MASEPAWRIVTLHPQDDRAAVHRFWYAYYVEQQALFRDIADHEARQLLDDCDPTAHVLVALAGEQASPRSGPPARENVDALEPSEPARVPPARCAMTVVGTMRANFGVDGLPRSLVEDFALQPFLDRVAESKIAVFSRLVVDPRFRAGRLSSALIGMMAQYVTTEGIELLFGDCELHLVNRYAAIGMRPYGHMLDNASSSMLVPLVVLRSDAAYQKAIRSPVGPILAQRPADSQTLAAAQDLLAAAPPTVITEALVGAEAFLAEARVIAQRARGPRANNPLLASLTDDELARLVRRAHVVHCPAGFALIRQEHVSRTLYIVLSGSLEVQVDGRTIARPSAGAVVGEVAFFLNAPRTADVLAGPDGAQVLALNNQSVHALIERDAPVAARFLLNMTRALCGKIGATAALLGA